MKTSKASIFNFLEFPDFLTLFGGILGVLGAMAAINHHFPLAAVLLVLTVPCDYFDGKIARVLGRRYPEFGAALDTIVDTVSFGICPVIFGYCLGLSSLFQATILIIFVGAAILRLARFTILPSSQEAFIGMPVTYNNLIFPLSYLVLHSAGLNSLVPWLFPILYLASAFLMASTIRWKKF
jgi:CDP-diacylglycerol---serine O-phosphatidyltransferase